MIIHPPCLRILKTVKLQKKLNQTTNIAVIVEIDSRNQQSSVINAVKMLSIEL